MSELMKRLQKASKLEHTSVMSESTIFNVKDSIPTPIPSLNIAYSASLDGGLTSGLHVWAGPSRHFKSLFCLISAAAYLHKYPDAVALFYDNEFGSPAEYFKSVGIDPSRVLHLPFTTLEELRTDVVNQLKEIKRGDKVIIMVDSLGLAASNKEVEDAESGSDKADMTRAKVNKSLFRIVTPHLRIKDIPMLVVQHTYQEMCVAGDTLIKTSRGNVQIKDINVDDMVYTTNGLQKVIHKYEPVDLIPKGKQFLKLKFDDGSEVRCTHDHKFLIGGEWVEAGKIALGTEFG